MRNEETSLIVVLFAVLVASIVLSFQCLPTRTAVIRPIACQ